MSKYSKTVHLDEKQNKQFSNSIAHFKKKKKFFPFRCNPFFVRCIKPNNMKVDLQPFRMFDHLLNMRNS